MHELHQTTVDAKVDRTNEHQKRAALMIGRFCSIAWAASTLPEYEEIGKKSHIINQVLQRTNLARPLMHTFITSNYDIVGIGKESIVTKNNDSEVLKHSIVYMGHSDTDLIAAKSRRNEINGYIKENLGLIAEPATYDLGSFRFRLSPEIPTIVGTQRYIPYSHDLFMAPEAIVTHPQIKSSIEPLLNGIDSMVREGNYLDLNGINNIVISEDENKNPTGISIVDTDLISEKNLHRNDKNGTSSLERFLKKRSYLESLI